MRCWLLPTRERYSLPRRRRQARHSAALPLNRNRVVRLRLPRTSAQRGLFLPRRTHTRCRGRKPHTAATRASRCGAGSAAPPTGSIGTIFSTVGRSAPSTLFRADEALSVAAFETRLKCRFALESSTLFRHLMRVSCFRRPVLAFRQGRSFPTTLLHGALMYAGLVSAEVQREDFQSEALKS